jgi:lauroyl/myristoyl acyltransferase
VNQYLEQEIRRVPEQYMWVHRRFKTRPKGEPPFYKKK